MAINEGTQNLPSDISGRYFIGGLSNDNNLYAFRFDSSKNLLVAFGSQSNVYSAQFGPTVNPTQLPNQVVVEVTIQADPSNTVNTLIGNSGDQHLVLMPGQALSGIKVSNLNIIWAKSVSAGVCWLNIFATY